MRLHDVASASRDVAGLSGRLEKVERMARLLAAVEPDEAPVVVAWLSGDLLQGRIGIGWATLQDVLPVEPADEPQLDVLEVHAALDGIEDTTGPGSRSERRTLLRRLLSRAIPTEQDFLVRLLLGELRQGAQEERVLEAVAAAARVEPAALRREVMFRGDAPGVAGRVLARGGEALKATGVRLFEPLKPMLAATAEDVEDALERLGGGGEVILEHKYDGARLQVHRDGDRVRVFTRRLNDETEALPEVVEAVRSLAAESVVLDGEALALHPDGRPRPFQETMRRFGRTQRVEEVRQEVPLTPFFFDLLYLDGASLVDHPAAERARLLDNQVPEAFRVPRLVTADPEEARAFLRRSRQAGHEGLMAKDPGAPYRAGRRGAWWLKIKPTYTADLVVLGAEWGSGRRQGWLSNLHLGARDAETGDPPRFVMVGKTFKGMTDAMLEWQTERLQELQRERRGRAVLVRPELVVEVAFDGLQTSPRYAGEVALRFARVRGYRDDKTPADADTIQHLKALHQARMG